MTKDGMCIGLIGPLPPPYGGMANQTEQLARLLEQDGVLVHIVQANAPYRPRWVASLRGVRAIFRLMRFLIAAWCTAGRVQLFHVMANSGWAWHLCAAPAIWIAKLRRIPVVVNYRGGAAEEFFARSIHWIRPTMCTADRVIVPSGFLQQVFARFGFAAEIVPNVIDLGRFSPRSGQRNAEVRHLIVTRNLEPIYDIETAIRAFAVVRKTYPRAHLTVAGSGPERERLTQCVHKLGLTEHVTFSGKINNAQIAELYRQADLMLNSSLVDNMPISILEALASGVPVVSTNVGGIPFVVEHQKTALLVPARDAEAMARAAVDLLGDPERAARLAKLGLETVQQYAWQNVRARWFSVYSQIAPGVPQSAVARSK